MLYKYQLEKEARKNVLATVTDTQIGLSKFMDLVCACSTSYRHDVRNAIIDLVSTGQINMDYMFQITAKSVNA